MAKTKAQLLEELRKLADEASEYDIDNISKYLNMVPKECQESLRRVLLELEVDPMTIAYWEADKNFQEAVRMFFQDVHKVFLPVIEIIKALAE